MRPIKNVEASEAGGCYLKNDPYRLFFLWRDVSCACKILKVIWSKANLEYENVDLKHPNIYAIPYLGLHNLFCLKKLSSYKYHDQISFLLSHIREEYFSATFKA